MRGLFLLLILICSGNIFGQNNITVTGKVTEKETGEALIGASVLLKGSNTGTVVDIEGNYILSNLPGGSILVFSSIGRKSEEVPVNNRTVINVSLAEDSQFLNEVVVVGYGTTKVKDLTAPITIIKSDELAKHAVSSPMSALQGKVAGVQIVNSGAPGSGPKVRIRGEGTFGNTFTSDRLKNEVGPLYVVDGMFYNNIDFLNTNDIENMSILKDASAASIYGVRAANGVIIVTTKKGVRGRPTRITFDGYAGIQIATNKLKMANSSQYAQVMRERKTLGSVNKSIEYYGKDENGNPLVNTDWYDELLRTAAIQNYSLDISGGTEKTTYSLGASYLNQNGVMNVKNNYKRLSLRLQTDFQAFSWLKLGANFILTNSSQINPEKGAWAHAYNTPSILPVYDYNLPDNESFPIKYAPGSLLNLNTYYNNPVAEAYYKSDKKDQIWQVLPNFFADIYLLPNNRLTLRSSYSQDISFLKNREFTPEYIYGANSVNANSKLLKRYDLTNSYIIDNTLTYNESISKHNFSVMLGTSIRSESWQYLKGEANGVPVGAEEYMYIKNGNAAGRVVNDDGQTYRGLSYFGRITYDYNGRYLLSATMRADGSSKYQEKWGYFPSIGLGWVISKESFMKDVKQINFLKLRGSWGKLGNDKVPGSDGFASIESGIDNSGILGGALIPGYVNKGFFSWLSWEKVSEFDIGADIKMFNSRLNIEMDYFIRTTTKAALYAPIPSVGGQLLQNGGKIENSGFEFLISWNDRIGKEFTYGIGFNGATLKNRVKNLNGLPYIYGGTPEFRRISKIGSAIDAFYGYEVEGVYQNAAQIAADPVAVKNNLEPGDFKYRDVNGDGVLDENDRVILGSHLPSFTYGMNINLGYKNFDFSMVFQGQAGAKLLNRKRGVYRWASDANFDEKMFTERWTGEGSTNKYPSAIGMVKPWNIGQFNSFFIESASFFRIQNIQLAYTLNESQLKKMKIQSIRLSLTADRPFTFFKSNGFTPEVSNGIDDQVYPLTSVFSFGIRITY